MPPEGQTSFTNALLSPGLDVPQNIVDPEGRVAPKRFAVYRNNVIVSLVEALAATFPAVKALVGDAFFNEMARQFARRHPPHSPLLFEYGRDLPAFVAAYQPARSLPFLGDVAALDRAWLDAYHAADATPLERTAVAMLEEDQLATARFNAHPAMRLVASQYPLVTIWQAARENRQPQFADEPQPETALIVRPGFDVQVVPLSSAEAGLFFALAAGSPLGEAAEQALEADPQFNFPAALARVIASGAFSSLMP
jgi:hypothetical protein